MESLQGFHPVPFPSSRVLLSSLLTFMPGSDGYCISKVWGSGSTDCFVSGAGFPFCSGSCCRREPEATGGERSTIRPHVETGLANLSPDAQDPPQCHEGAERVVSAYNPRDPGLETLMLCIRGPCGKMKLSVSKRISGGFRMQAGWSS